MTTAVIGLAGIIIGAVLAGLLDLIKGWRQEKALARGVVKVLVLDLIELDSQLRWSLDDGVLRLSNSEAARISETWLKNRELLGRRLPPDDWATVARTFQTVLIWGDRDGEELDERDQAQIGAWLDRVDRSQHLLTEWPARISPSRALPTTLGHET